MNAPGEKLIALMWKTLVKDGAGSLLKPLQIRRESRANAEARRHELLMLAQIEMDVADVRAGRAQYLPDGSLKKTGNEYKELSSPNGALRIEPSLSLHPDLITSKNHAEFIREEINQCKAIIYAEMQLSDDTQPPSSEEIDNDWLHAWRDHAGKTSNENIQKLWGSVLAGELKCPGSYSLRTLEFLRCLSKQEAELIQRIAPFALYSQIIWRNIKTLEQAGISYGALLKLQELGIIFGVETDSTTMDFKSTVPDKFVKTFTLHGRVAIATHQDKYKIVDLPVINITTIGREVIRLGQYQPNAPYFSSLCKTIADKGFSVEIGDYIEHSNEQIGVMNVEVFKP
ncbi:DUF2806 domain-containing protein [Pseudomonas sp. Pse1]|uniref:DUF2806 domain-containing protein n=1 Tax=Pseudomonas sp. Pse1 TaxID=2926020 RepID=UPI002117D5DB|nr:DUF2806 domain-containing protein [Pseudomonas sp. Pse1]